MDYYQQQTVVSALNKALEHLTEPIEGVDFKIYIDRKASFESDYQVSIVSQFDLPRGIAQNEVFDKVLAKVHEITSMGQVRLELEK